MSTAVVAQSPVALRDSEGERISFGGVEITFKNPPGDEGGWTVLDYRLPAGQFGAVLHYHEVLVESFYILEGEIWFRVGDQEITLGRGGFALVPPGVAHSFANKTDAPARMVAHASSADHKRFLRELFALIEREPVWPPKDPGKMIELGKRYDTIYLR
jgi:mannose-6-phosphate isomerase-like protein (cupin superfamily)